MQIDEDFSHDCLSGRRTVVVLFCASYSRSRATAESIVDVRSRHTFLREEHTLLHVYQLVFSKGEYRHRGAVVPNQYKIITVSGTKSHEKILRVRISGLNVTLEGPLGPPSLTKMRKKDASSETSIQKHVDLVAVQVHDCAATDQHGYFWTLVSFCVLFFPCVGNTRPQLCVIRDPRGKIKVWGGIQHDMLSE